MDIAFRLCPDQSLKSVAIFALTSALRSSSSSPISPTIRSFRIVATLSNLITESALRPVFEKPGRVEVIWIPDSTVFTGVFDEIKATTISCSPSWRTSAGQSLVAVRSVKGNGIRTIFPFIGTQP